ncbi:hypothetical protein F2P56_012315 [Juglans regia]|uniref:F-box domain-containing protein n=2 Tax=Juglans regia TaxID=51240 RepID=A0A834CY31_JUGRE|nr:F-box/LRR-repeat protein At3g48880-like [Juglans regia]KAF5468138.1 hypothetical protein F2P56_012315 [Juglans regia]
MRERKWEELNRDCLVEVLRRLGIEALLMQVPLVCRSWYEASLDPICWKNLNFHTLSSFRPSPARLRPPFRSVSFYNFFTIPKKEDLDVVTAFVRFVVDRSHRSATTLVVADFFTEQALEYASEQCPELKWLYLPRDFMLGVVEHIPQFIGRWESLELLYVEGCSYLDKILTPISTNCQKFFALCCNHVEISDEAAILLVKLASKVKYLRISVSQISRDNLEMLLEGCKHLKLLCFEYFDGVDDVIFGVGFTSHIMSLFMKDPMLQDCCYEDLFPSKDKLVYL